MNEIKKIIYTESAKDRLSKFYLDVENQLEDYLRDRKFVPGDDFIEVTASDIDEAAYKFRFVRPLKTNTRKLIPVVYSIMGLIMTITGLYYEQIRILLEGNPVRLIFIISGITMLFIGWFYLYYLRIRDNKFEKERMMYEAEQRHRQKMKDDE